VLVGTKLGSASTEKMCRAMHKCRLDAELRKVWMELLVSCDHAVHQTTKPEVINILLLHIIRNTYKNILIKETNLTCLTLHF
jgi:hypothetical protein